jgi:ABC-type uncharacterized transport system permease subunit
MNAATWLNIALGIMAFAVFGVVLPLLAARHAKDQPAAALAVTSIRPYLH